MNLIELGKKAIEEKRQKEIRAIEEARKIMAEFVKCIQHDDIMFEYYGDSLLIKHRITGNSFVTIQFNHHELHRVTFHTDDHDRHMYYPEPPSSCKRTLSFEIMSLKQFAIMLVEFIEKQSRGKTVRVEKFRDQTIWW